MKSHTVIEWLAYILLVALLQCEDPPSSYTLNLIRTP